NYKIKLSNGEQFEQIASDGGLLNEAVELTELQLTPSERAEIVIDFSQFETGEEIKLMMDDETVLLPFKIEEEKPTGKNTIEPVKNEEEITEEEKNMPVTKEINVSGIGNHDAINEKQYDKDKIDITQKERET